VPLGGRRIVPGLRGECGGALDGLGAATTAGGGAVMDRRRYAALYGPTKGDRIRLADTNLLIEVEQGPVRRRGARTTGAPAVGAPAVAAPAAGMRPFSAVAR